MGCDFSCVPCAVVSALGPLLIPIRRQQDLTSNGRRVDIRLLTKPAQVSSCSPLHTHSHSGTKLSHVSGSSTNTYTRRRGEQERHRHFQKLPLHGIKRTISINGIIISQCKGTPLIGVEYCKGNIAWDIQGIFSSHLRLVVSICPLRESPLNWLVSFSRALLFIVGWKE